MNPYDPYSYNNGWYPPPPPSPPVNPLAVASFVLGLVSTLCGFITAIPAIITGVIALVQYSRAYYPHRWMAIVGIVLGCLQFLTIFFFFGFGILSELWDLW